MLRLRTNYCTFGAPLYGRTQSPDKYKYGFNGKEEDNEINGSGNSYSFEYRALDSRIGRFFSRDLAFKKLPHYSPYCFAGNSPIQAIDYQGLAPVKPNAMYVKKYTSTCLNHDKEQCG